MALTFTKLVEERDKERAWYVSAKENTCAVGTQMRSIRTALVD